MGCKNGASLVDDDCLFQKVQGKHSDLRDTLKISCPPEAECCFKRKKETIFDKECKKGKLDIELNSSFESTNNQSKVADNLQEFEATDLAIKTIWPPKKSSYESLYDSTRFENTYSALGPTTIMVGDRFQGTFGDLKLGSFENLYSQAYNDEACALNPPVFKGE